MSYPLFLNVRDLPCLVVGGGRVGFRKARGLLEAGALVTVVDPEPLEALTVPGEGLTLKRREFCTADLEGMRLVFAATHSKDVNAAVAEGARLRGIFCNVADDPSASDFFLPALVKRGDLVLAISTGGRSPAFARRLRMDLEASLDDAYLPFLDLMGRVREILLQREHAPDSHREIFRALVEGSLLEDLRRGDRSAVIRALVPLVGKEMAETLVLSVMQSDVPSPSGSPGLFRKKEESCR